MFACARVFVAVLAFLSCCEWGLLLVAVHGLLIAEQRLWCARALVVAAPGCSSYSLQAPEHRLNSCGTQA